MSLSILQTHPSLSTPSPSTRQQLKPRQAFPHSPWLRLNSWIRERKTPRSRPYKSKPATLQAGLDEDQRVARDFNDSACEFCDRYKTTGLSRSSKILFEFLFEEGINDKSVL